MIKEIHQSHLNTGFRCMEQLRRRYFLNEIIPPGIAAGTGTSVHFAAEQNHKIKMVTGEDEPLSVLTDATRDGFVKAFSNGIFFEQRGLARQEKNIKRRLK